MIESACQALKYGYRLELIYHGHSRVVEVHAVGYTAEGNAILRAWQVRGGSVHGERTGWKLFRLDEAGALRVSTEKSRAPRTGYTPDDPAMEKILCRVTAEKP